MLLFAIGRRLFGITPAVSNSQFDTLRIDTLHRVGGYTLLVKRYDIRQADKIVGYDLYAYRELITDGRSKAGVVIT